MIIFIHESSTNHYLFFELEVIESFVLYFSATYILSSETLLGTSDEYGNYSGLIGIAQRNVILTLII